MVYMSLRFWLNPIMVYMGLQTGKGTGNNIMVRESIGGWLRGTG